MTARALPALAALVAVALASTLGALVAQRMRTRLAAPPAIGIPTEPPVLDRPPFDPLPMECEGGVPANELTYGAATLRLRLRDDRSGAPASMRVRLWRLDVPEDEEWSAGDELRAALDVTEDGFAVERLPAGRYRVQCLAARDAPDPPEFDLADGVNERDVAVPVRRTFRLRLQLVDERGDAIPQSMRCEGSGARGFGPEKEGAPEWVTPRQPKLDELPAEQCWMLGGVGHTYPKYTGPIVSADEDGYYFVGRHQESGRHGYERSSMSFRVESRASVSVDVGWNDEPGVDSTFVGVAPSTATLLAHVVHTNGDVIDPSVATAAAGSVATRHPWDAPADAWRTIPVDVEVTVAGYETLKFVWTAATADVEHRLIPLPPRVPIPPRVPK